MTCTPMRRSAGLPLPASPAGAAAASSSGGPGCLSAEGVTQRILRDCGKRRGAGRASRGAVPRDGTAPRKLPHMPQRQCGWDSVSSALLQHHRAGVEAGVDLVTVTRRLVAVGLDAHLVLVARLELVDVDLTEDVGGALPKASPPSRPTVTRAPSAHSSVSPKHDAARRRTPSPSGAGSCTRRAARCRARRGSARGPRPRPALEVVLLGHHELDGLGRADLAAAGLGPAVVEQVGAARCTSAASSFSSFQ